MTYQAKLFVTGGLQAVCLPDEFRFAGDVVYVSRHAATDDVILSSRPPRLYADFMALRDSLADAPDDWMSAAKRVQQSQARDPFAGEEKGR